MTRPIDPILPDGARDRSGAGASGGARSDESGALDFGARLGQWLLELHRDCLDPQPADFCRWALDRLAQAVAFDSASWGHGEVAPILIHEVYLHNQPADKAEVYARYRHDDYLFPEVMRRPGTTIDMYDLVPRAEHVRRPIYRHYARRYGGEHGLCTSLPHPRSGLGHFINLWRADFATPFSPADRMFKQLAMPHLVHARRRNLFEHIRPARSAAPTGGHVALCDPLGTLHDAEPGFAAVLGGQWPGWAGPMLPEVLRSRMRRRERGEVRVGEIAFEWSPIGSMLRLRAWRLRGADRLSSRERDVARLLADGHSHKAIARILGVEPTTIRTQTYRLYRKLGVRNRAQMVGAWLAAGLAPADDQVMPRSRPIRPRP